MESYLADEATLGQIVDSFIAEKYPNQPLENFASVRKNAIKSLDHQILKSILGQLTKEQGAELSHILDGPHDESDLEGFFAKYHVDLQDTISRTVKDFKTAFLKGGQNE